MQYNILLQFIYIAAICVKLLQFIYIAAICVKSEVTNMRPAKEFPVAREHFDETSTFKHFFPV